MWFKVQDEFVKLRVIAKPNAKKTQLLQITDQGLHIAIHAKPYKGEANKELILYLSKLFHVPKSHITLQSGEGNKYKQIIIPISPLVHKLLLEPTNFFNK